MLASVRRLDLGALIEIDLRSLALFRIAVALVVLADLASRVRDVDALYGATGVLPPELARTLWGFRVAASPFTWVAAWPALLWTGVGLLALAALSLGLGVFPRVAAVATWGLLASLQDRNPALSMVGDRYLLLLLMWCILLPTGTRLSLRPGPPGVTRIRSWAGAGLLLQVVLVYVITGLKKTGPEWFDGTALWYALSFEQYVTAAGRWLRSQTALIAPLSFAVKWVEIVGPLLVLSPWRNDIARVSAVGLLWGLHLGLQVFHAIGVFQLVGLAAWLAFLPSTIWERGAARGSADRGVPIRSGRVVHPAGWSEILAMVPIAYLIVVLIYTVTGVLVRGDPYPPPRAVNIVAVHLHIHEGWSMFASARRLSRNWFLAPGVLADGSEVEVLRRTALDWDRPSDLQSAQRGFRWTQYLHNAVEIGIHKPAFRETHAVLLKYLCREWNVRHEPGGRLERVTLVLVSEVMTGPGSARPPTGDRYPLATIDCPSAGTDRAARI